MIAGQLSLLLVLGTAVGGTEEDEAIFPSKNAAAVGLSLEDFNALQLEARQSDGEENSNLFEGDIEITRPQLGEIFSRGKSLLTPLNARITKPVWPGGIVPYMFDKNVPNRRRKMIQLAILEFMEKVNAHGKCLVIRPKRQSDQNHIHIRMKKNKNGKGRCSSKVGFMGGRQYLNLGKPCYKIGKIQHEFLHALGFWHEHSRDDRDNYVTIIWENIRPGKEHNFKPHETANQGFGYDYGSVMHYRANTFSIDKKKKLTIVTKGGQKIGQRVGVSDQDVEEVRKLYGC